MRYHIVKRNTRIILFGVLVVAAFMSSAPWIYRKVFVREKTVIMRDETWSQHEFSGFFSDTEVYRNISMDLNFLGNDYVFSELRLRDLDVKGAAVSADIFIKGRFVRDETGAIKGLAGKLVSRNALLNSEPVMNGRMSFDLTRDELKIESLRIGKPYGLKGRIGLIGPFDIDLRLDITRADIKDLTLGMRKEKLPVMLGMMNGVFYIKGTFDNLISSGILKSRNGRIGPIDYDVATIRFEGFGPMINIVDSSVRRGEGALTMEGYIDLRMLTKGNMFEGLKLKSDMMTVVWDGWDIGSKGKDELTMKKDISDKVSVGFKTMSRTPITSYYDRQSPEEMSLEYKIGEENLKLKLKENEEFFGVEHSVKF